MHHSVCNCFSGLWQNCDCMRAGVWRSIVGVPALEQLLKEAAKLAHSDAGALACVQRPPHALLQHLHVRGLLLADCCAEGVVGAEQGVL